MTPQLNSCGVFYLIQILKFVAHVLRMKYILFFLCLSFGLNAQILKREKTGGVRDSIRVGDTLVVDRGGSKDSLAIYKPIAEDYRFRTRYSDYKLYDTALTVQDSYEYTQYNNRDNFGKIQFANIGSGFQDLMYKVNPEQILSLLPTRKSHFILGSDDVKYYDVKTPTTSFIYHTAMRNGAALQTTYTQNVGKNVNFALEYMGLRSQGFYDNNLAANNNTLFSGNFRSKNGRYEAFTHFLHQNVNNEENGGLQDLSLFLGGDSRFDNRENLLMNLTNSHSRFSYRRYYYSHTFAPFNVEKFPFKIGHTVSHQGNKYYFNLGNSDTGFYTDIIAGRALGSKKYSKNLSNIVSLILDNEKFKLDAGVKHQNIQFGVENFDDSTETNIEISSKEDRIGAVGRLQIRLWDKLGLNSFLEYSTGKQFGNYLRSQNDVTFEPIKGYFADAKVNFQSVAPSFNYLLNISPIGRYNYNFTDFKNESILEVGGKIGLKWFDAQLLANYFRIDNFAYFDATGAPKQSSSAVNISQIGGEATFSYNKFHLNTKLLFQGNLDNKELLPMPGFIGRGNLYWQSKAFKNAAEIMTGLKVYYFSKFASRDFSPVLNEFILPDSRAYSIGGQPIADAYFNLKVKTMQFFIEAQHFNTTFMQNESYTAPYYPIYDFRLNIGIVWHLFH